MFDGPTNGKPSADRSVTNVQRGSQQRGFGDEGELAHGDGSRSPGRTRSITRPAPNTGTPTPPHGIAGGRPGPGHGPRGRGVCGPVATRRTGRSDDHLRATDDPAAADP